MILGILVSGIIASRKIVENAEIQSIITEVQNYRSAVVQFTASYGGLPGTLKTEKINGALGDVTDYFNNATNKISLIGSCGVGTADECNFISKYNMLNAFKQLGRAGLIETVSDIVNGISSPTTNFYLNWNLSTTFSSGTTGVSIRNAANNINSTNWLPFSASSKKKNVWLLANVGEIALFEPRVTPGWRGHTLQLILSGSGEKCGIPITKDSAALSAATAYKLDMKIDDGLPMSGLIVASKWLMASPATVTDVACGVEGIAGSFSATPGTTGPYVATALNDATYCHTGVHTSTTMTTTTLATVKALTGVTYATSRTMDKGCIMSFQVEYSRD